MIKKLIEDISRLTEQGLDEINLQDEMEGPAEPVEAKPAFNDGMSLADTLDAKAKIARCLEALKDAVQDFKNASAEKLDLLQDSALLQGIEGLDQKIIEIEQALAGGSNILGDSELNDAFRAELPQGEEEDTEDSEDSGAEETVEDIEDELEDEEEEDYHFDDEAGLDLFSSEE